jgi:predicted cupin superfamily sugar epimerase
MTAEDVIRLLGLQAHPLEGGYFRETYRLATPVPTAAGERSLCTAIYYLLTPTTCSAMHRLPGDEIFHFYLGDPVTQLHLRPDGTGELVQIGPDLAAGQRPQVVVPGGTWQGAVLAPGGRFALLGATMAPGFDYADYESGKRAELAERWPQFAEWVGRLCS